MKNLRNGLICLAVLACSFVSVNTSEARCGSRVVGALRVAKNSVVKVVQARPGRRVVKALTNVRPVRAVGRVVFGR